MKNLLILALLNLLVLSGCGGSGAPTRHNDFIPLTSIVIVAESPTIQASRTIAAKTSTKLTVIGNFSGQFTRDITDQALWASSAPTVAEFITVNVPNRVSGHVAGSANLTATVGTLTASFPLTVSATTISTVTVSPATVSVAKGLTTQFTAVGTFVDSTTQDLTFDATWSTTAGNSSATVSDLPASKGLATGLTEGTVTITATFGATPGNAQLTVTPAVLQSISVTPANSSVAGFIQTVSFTATGAYSDGTTADITSTSAWSSSQTGIATVVATTGVATTVAAGTTSISAAKDGLSAATNLTVTALSLVLTPLSKNMFIGQKVNFILTATPAGGVSQDVTANSNWVSTTPAVATVGNTATDKGIVTGVTVGSTTITVTYNGQTASATVSVQ